MIPALLLIGRCFARGRGVSPFHAAGLLGECVSRPARLLGIRGVSPFRVLPNPGMRCFQVNIYHFGFLSALVTSGAGCDG